MIKVIKPDGVTWISGLNDQTYNLCNLEILPEVPMQFQENEHVLDSDIAIHLALLSTVLPWQRGALETHPPVAI